MAEKFALNKVSRKILLKNVVFIFIFLRVNIYCPYHMNILHIFPWEIYYHYGIRDRSKTLGRGSLKFWSKQFKVLRITKFEFKVTVHQCFLTRGPPGRVWPATILCGLQNHILPYICWIKGYCTPGPYSLRICEFKNLWYLSKYPWTKYLMDLIRSQFYFSRGQGCESTVKNVWKSLFSKFSTIIQ